mgnify:CR=1 FL=1
MVKRILLSIVMLVLIAYLAVAITAFNRKPADQTCRDMELVIKDTAYAGFITKDELKGILQQKGIYPIGKKMERISTKSLERELSKHPLINGIKEASGNISQVARVAALCGDALNIYSGNDDQVVPLLSLGGKGVISVVSNVAPELVHNCCQAFFDRDTAKACALQLEMLPLEEALFCEVNPIPVKYAMNVLGWNAGECRLPLVEPSDAHKAKIEQALQAAGLIKE